MNVRDLEFNGDAESPAWFARIDEENLKCDLYISAGGNGPDERQYGIMDRFLGKRESLLAIVHDIVSAEYAAKKLRMDSFKLGAIFIHGANEGYDLEMAGSVKKKRFLALSDVPWNATVNTSTYEVTLEPQPNAPHNGGRPSLES